ncbi:MAG TPA: leucyl aminopeptidase [Usitatibacteraceae bacterium]|nr:leucyl aminopeptidase [Usitatibacteraceae bacterium]
MEFSTSTADLSKIKTDCVIAGVFDGGKLSKPAKALDKAARGALEKALANDDMTGKSGTTMLLQNVSGIAAKRVLLVGCGPEKDYGRAAFNSALGAAFKALKSTTATDVVIPLVTTVGAGELAWKVQQAACAAVNGAYRFNRLKSKPDDKHTGKAVTFHFDGKVDDKSIKAAMRRGEAVGEGMKLTKDLGNLPPNIATPAYLADTAKDLAKKYAFKCTILEKKDMEKLGMNTLLSVSKASYQPPKFIILEHHGGKKGAAPVVLVGKGITFDTGGISLKPGAEMDEMKYDMQGAGSMLGVMKTVGMLKLPLNVVMLVPTCENMPGGNATRPGDIVKSMNGITVEILNTDAEGRLILCDALTYAERYKPAVVVDAATLTGAMVIALGHITTGIFANDDALAQELVGAGREMHDAAWHLPMGPEYDEMLKSNFADLPNISGGRAGGSITAACFLGRFTKSYKWAHMDIAGTAWKSGADKGATGRPVPLLAQFLFKRAGL